MAKTYKGAIAGDLILEKGDDASQVTSIGGSLDVRQGAQCDLPQVTSIGGYLDVSEGAQCDLPQVTSIGGYLEIKPRGKLTAPNLKTINGEPISAPADQAALLKQVADHALAAPENFTMSDWHACGTAHCIAGWAVHLKGEEGYALEKKVGPATAGALLLGTDAAAMFFLSKDEATGRLEMIRQGVVA